MKQGLPLVLVVEVMGILTCAVDAIVQHDSAQPKFEVTALPEMAGWWQGLATVVRSWSCD